jgi:hypothetical protein
MFVTPAQGGRSDAHLPSARSYCGRSPARIAATDRQAQQRGTSTHPRAVILRLPTEDPRSPAKGGEILRRRLFERLSKPAGNKPLGGKSGRLFVAPRTTGMQRKPAVQGGQGELVGVGNGRPRPTRSDRRPLLSCSTWNKNMRARSLASLRDQRSLSSGRPACATDKPRGPRCARTSLDSFDRRDRRAAGAPSKPRPMAANWPHRIEAIFSEEPPMKLPRPARIARLPKTGVPGFRSLTTRISHHVVG